jgi:sulfur-oxidizing protein SoxY
MPTRRQALTHVATLAGLLMACGLWPQHVAAASTAAAWDGATVEAVLQALGATALPQESAQVRLTVPDVVENGAVVPVTLATALTGVRSLAVLVEKNPNILAAVFHLSESLEPALATRIKMDQSSNVYAVALMADGRALFARQDVRVTIGGCGE